MRKVLSAAVFTTVAAFASSAWAQTGAALLLKPLMSDKEIWESRGDVLVPADGDAGPGLDFQMSVFDYVGRFREQRARLIPRIGWDAAWYVMDSDLPILDQDLLDASVAAGLELGTFSDWRAGFTAGVGYAGNSPFGEGDAWYGKATLVLGRKLDPKTDLAFVIDYDGNRTVMPDIPLPGFAYRHQFDPTISYTLGVPLSSVTWKANERTTVEATWTLLDTFDARLEYQLSPKWTAYGALQRRQEGFSVDGLENNDRLLFEQRRAEMGLRWQPWEHTSFLIAGGYAFHGEFSIGFDMRDSDEIADLSDEPYVRFAFERRF